MAAGSEPGRTPRGHYSFATTHGGFVFTAGHLPAPPDGARAADMPFDDQVRSVFRKLFETLEAAGARPEDVLQVTVYLVGMDRWTRFNELFAGIFGNHRPARTVVPVPELHYGYLLEVEAIAAASAP
jgi:enamine deaminase RidA (YjgF/YER057c/UK114 family)